MGLDMYLNGKKFLPTDWENDENNLKEDGFQVTEKTLKLGYWRKHPDLHGYIVQEFGPKDKTTGEPTDDCRPIDLEKEDLQKIIAAVAKGQLPKTGGFFFGESSDPDEQETTVQLTRALDWLSTKGDTSWRSVEYQASW